MTVTIRHGDCREILRTMPYQSVHCCVTSPPYFGLRDYGTATWEGGDPDCDHRRFNGYASRLEGGTEAQDIGKLFKDTCNKCGAARIDSQIGLEPTPDAYVAEMVAVFREVRRVLRDDGTLWLNLGDSYSGSGKGVWNASDERKADVKETYRPLVNPAKVTTGLKPKDLIGIPWRVAFALQADGWYLRQDIIWSKPNPMPESVTDRCTKAHEYLFLLSKSARYYYDADAVAETSSENSHGALNGDPGRKAKLTGNHSGPLGLVPESGKRNRRSVWEVATQPFSEAHFATFPPALIEPCIKAGCPIGGTVLDPFGGAGTTGLVADRLGRDAILIELNPEYAAMADRRIRGDAGMFAEISVTSHERGLLPKHREKSE